MLNFLGKFTKKSLAPASNSRGWFSIIREPFTGAWQRNKEEKTETILTYPTLYACVSRIAQDIGKLPFIIKKRVKGIWKEVENNPALNVLRKPNHYQTAQQFRESWILSKLTQGNTYVLKERDGRGKIQGLYILDPHRVIPMVADNGEVFYQLSSDKLSGILETETITVPASEIIHDRCICPFHPLIGLPPIAAASIAVIKNMKIMKSAAEFFSNGARPGGILIAPGAIGDDDAKKLSEYWNTNFTGDRAGRVAVLGDGMKFESLSSKSTDAQMIEQLRYSDEQICQTFGVPPFKVGIGSIPAGMKVDDMNMLYFSDALQTHVEAMENLLDYGMDISLPEGVELDLWPLLRMDPLKQAEYETKLIGGAVKTPNESRKNLDLDPKEGGDAIYLQQQNYSLEALARRDAKADPFSSQSANNPANTVPDENTEDAAKMMALFIEREVRNVLSNPA